MASMADSLVQQLTSSGALAQVSNQLGVDEATSSKAISTAVPLLMTALARNASQPDGASSLLNAITNDHDGSSVDDIAGYLANPNTEDGDGILRHTLGDQRNAVETNLSASTGLDPATLGKLLSMAAPLILSMLAKQQKQGAMDSDGLSDMLKQEQKANAGANPDLMGMLTGALDMNDDGSVLDDLGKLAGGLFKRKSSL